MLRVLFFLTLILTSFLVLGDWEVLPDGSYIGFASVKNDLIAENHTFRQLSGKVTADGTAKIEVALASVETLIPIRNERMQKMLFNVAEYPVATVKSMVPIEQISSINDGDSVTIDLDIAIELHGIQLKKSVPVKVIKAGEDRYDVTSLGPIIIHASQFALSDNVEALRQIAGLQSIDLMVPVTFDLRFVTTN